MKSRLLRYALAGNFVFSSLCALTLVIVGSSVASLMGITPAWLLNALGIGLFGFAALIGFALIRIRIGLALIISTLDLLWVLTTLPLIFVPGLLTSYGAILVGVVAAFVGTFGLFQLFGIRAILSEGAASGYFRHCIRLRSSAEPTELWPVIRNLGAISRYSAGLSASRLEGGDEAGPGTARVCTNHKGQSWTEEVERLDDNERFVSLRFRSEAEDFPFPLDELSGGWSVHANTNGGSFVDIWWIVKPQKHHLGWLAVALMTVPLDRDVPKIVAAMEADAIGAMVPQGMQRSSFVYC